MLVSTKELLDTALSSDYAIGAFNVYNLEGARAVVAAAEAERSPAMLQIHPGALRHGGAPLISLCLTAARDTPAPISVHLDHSTSEREIRAALDAGLLSIMADGSHLPYDENVAFTRAMADLVHAYGGAVEAELGRLSGTEDSLTVPEHEARLTGRAQAAEFAARTGVDALAVCVGNIHGRYRTEPRLDFDRLAAIREALSVPLVLHGASGLCEAAVRLAIGLGVAKFNVNTEVREAYVEALKTCLDGSRPADLADLMEAAIRAMRAIVAAKLRLFGSAGMA